jgi:hypothetical protein
MATSKKTTSAARGSAAAAAKAKTGAEAPSPTAKKPAAAAANGGAEKSALFDALRAILKRHERELVVVHDKADNYYLDTPTKDPNKNALFFAAARAGRAYTSFYLMPVYTNPELLGAVSPELKKRMQGKSCFNFKSAEPGLLKELSELTEKCFGAWKAAGRI